MSYLNFIIHDLELFREFDLTNYIYNARYTIEGNYNIIKNNISFETYRKTLLDLIPSIKSITTLNPEVLAFFGSCNKNLFNLNDKINSITPIDIADIKPQYLTMYVGTIGSLIDNTIKGNDTKDDIDMFTDMSSVFKLKRQMVKTSLPYEDNLIIYSEYSVDTAPKINLSSDYVQKAIIPFLKSVNMVSGDLSKLVDSALTAISKSENDILAYNAAINNIVNNGDIDSSTVKRLNYITYNCYRTLMELVSFLTAMVTRKVSYYVNYSTMCVEIKNRIENSMNNNPVVESISDTVLPEDNHNLADDLQQGRADAYDSIANNIYEYNTGVLMNSPESPMVTLGNSVQGSIETRVDDIEYDRTAYDETIKMFTIVSRGLDILSQYSDDYLMVFDDILDKAGFQLNLEDRFRGLLGGLDDVVEYTSAANVPTESTNIYFKMLSEVKNYGKNMEDIAKSIYECRMKIDTLDERFNNNINGEYANAEAINELKIFVEDFIDQFNKLVNIVAGKFMLRLKNINIAIEILNNKRIDNNDINNEICENTNFNTTTINDFISEYNALTDAMFEELAKEYTVAKEMKTRGCRIVFEADGATGGQAQPAATPAPTQQGSQTINNTTQTSTTTNKSGFTQKILEQMSKWFDQLSSKLNDIINSQMAKNDQAYIQKFKNELLSKDYTNLSTQQPIYNYETLMPYNNIITDMSGLKNRVNSGTMQKLNSVNNKNDIIKVIFPSTPPVSVFNSDKMADAITQYYKVGVNTGSQPMNYSGDSLKTLVTNAVGYCENCYTNIVTSIQQDISSIKSNFESAITTVIKENGYDETFGFLFTEEEAAAATQQANNVNNMNDKVNSMRNYITQYCNAVLTAVFDREKDYMALLRTFVNESSNT